jgi:hypothetical protein
MATKDDFRRSTLRHFVPGVTTFYAAYFLLASDLPAWQGMVLMGTQAASMVVGYRLALRATKKKLRPLSSIRAFAAGVTAPLILGVSLLPLRWGKLVMPGETVELFASSAAVGALAGAFMAAVMFVRGRRPGLEEPAAIAELPGEALEDWFERVEKEAEKEPWYRAVTAPLIRVLRRLRPEWAT